MTYAHRVVLAYWQPLAAALLLAGAALLCGCSPHIGDKCAVNSDCSLQGNLQCDTSQPNGYCTFFNCTSNSCQNSAACVAVNANVPGCTYDDYTSPSRTAVNMCLESCSKDSDCRTGDGYVCRDPREPPWNAQIVDNNVQRVCLPLPNFFTEGGVSLPTMSLDGAPPNICSAAGPAFPIQSSDASGEAGGDAAIDGGADAGGASDAGAPDGAAAADAADAAGGG
jgi:hypothetical protein